jgi:hypothetical protein
MLAGTASERTPITVRVVCLPVYRLGHGDSEWEVELSGATAERADGAGRRRELAG